MILVITEKATQMNKLQKILKNRVNHSYFAVEGEYKNIKIIIVSLSGHIFNVPDLGVFDKRFKNKTFAETKNLLPVLPPENNFYQRVLTDKKYKSLYEFIKQYAIQCDKIIIAPDPDFEGAALAFEVLFYIKGALKKIYSMMDMNNLNEQVLKKNFEKALKGEGLNYKTMAYIGLLRGDLNYGVGINTSRYLIGSLNNKSTFGTQQSRLIDLIIKRSKKYFEFKKKEFYTLKIKTDIGDFVFKPKDEELKFDKNYIYSIKNKLQNLKIVNFNKIEKENIEKKPLKWFDGSDVAQEASKILKIPAISLMDEKNGLLEKMYLNNILTYPRGDSKKIMPLSELQNQIAIAKNIEPLYNAKCDFNLIKENLWYDDNTKNLGVNHTPFTIARADIDINALSKDEKVIFDIVAKRLLSIFYPNPIVLKKTIKINIDGFDFVLTEESDVLLGWKELYGEKFKKSIIPDDIYSTKVLDIVIEKDTTKPQPLFTLNSIITEMKRKNIGAESTYKQLVQVVTDSKRPYIRIKKGKLIPTEFAINFFNIIPDEAINVLNDFEKIIIDGLLNRQITFINAFKERNILIEKVFYLIKNEIDTKKDFLIEILNSVNFTAKNIGKCPLCGADVIEKEKYYCCSNRKVKKENDKWIVEGCKFLIFKKYETNNMRFNLSSEKVKKLLKDKKIEIEAYSKNKRKNFNMELLLNNGQIKFVFDTNGSKKGF